MVMDAALKGMNDKQSEAVLATEGPVLIMAGAGSGKTRVLTHRIAYLVEEKHVNPWNILAITFTNKAAREMRERVGKLVDAEIARDIWVSTFHALCVRILRRDIDKLRYNRAFTIADPAEQLTLVKHILADFNLDPKRYDPKSILGAISSAKMNSWIHKLMPMNRLTVLSPKLWRRFMRNIKSVCAVIRHWTLMISSCRPSCF